MFKQTMIKLGFKLIKSLFIAKINFAPAKLFAEASLKPLERIANAYLDNNPDDQAQLEKIWYEENDQFVAASFESIEAAISAKVEDPEKKEWLLEIIRTVKPEVLTLVEGPNQ